MLGLEVTSSQGTAASSAAVIIFAANAGLVAKATSAGTPAASTSSASGAYRVGARTNRVTVWTAATAKFDRMTGLPGSPTSMGLRTL